jgi:hypothetical protein
LYLSDSLSDTLPLNTSINSDSSVSSTVIDTLMVDFVVWPLISGGEFGMTGAEPAALNLNLKFLTAFTPLPDIASTTNSFCEDLFGAKTWRDESIEKPF